MRHSSLSNRDFGPNIAAKLRSVAFLLLASAQFSHGQVLSTVFSFDGLNGLEPLGPLVQCTDGNFYGVTSATITANSPGFVSHGTVFRLTPGGNLTTLHTFPISVGVPQGGLLQASDGNLYGATSSGNGYAGTIFRIGLDGSFATLYAFNGPEGFSPNGSLIQSTDGNLYGTTSSGGSSYGTVFRMTTSGRFTLLYSFTGPDGQEPSSLTPGNDGYFYGTSAQGGATGTGTVFRISREGALTTLYSFGSSPQAAYYPYGGVMQATDGNFWGTTS